MEQIWYGHECYAFQGKPIIIRSLSLAIQFICLWSLFSMMQPLYWLTYKACHSIHKWSVTPPMVPPQLVWPDHLWQILLP